MSSRYWTLCALTLATSWAQAQDAPRIEIEMDAARIQTNRELPMLLYIVPWKDTELSGAEGERTIVIHNLFGNFYDPIMPGADPLNSQPDSEEAP